MTITSGFFNSINGDRKYDSLQMAELFDGLINDGVYETIYKQFRVSVNSGFTIQVDTGRGWFKHTWIKNDAIKLFEISIPDPIYNRIDAVVIEIDHRDIGRRDDIKVIQGTPSTSATRPTLTQTDEVYQVPLAYISVKSNASSITTSDITNMVGTSECPFVTGVVDVMDIDWLIAQWQSQWGDRLLEHESEWENWYFGHVGQYQSDWENWYTYYTQKFELDFHEWIAKLNDLKVDYEYDFTDWFARLQAMLDGDVAANLANRVIQLENIIDELLRNGIILNTIDDSDGNPIQDSYGHDIEGVVKYAQSGSCTCP